MHVAAYIFIRFGTDAFMACEMITERKIMSAFISHHRCFLRDIGLNNWNYIGGACALDVERTHLLALAVNKRQYRVFVAVAATLNRALLAADECFINFNNPATAAHWRKLAGTEGFTNTVR